MDRDRDGAAVLIWHTNASDSSNFPVPSVWQFRDWQLDRPDRNLADRAENMGELGAMDGATKMKAKQNTCHRHGHEGRCESCAKRHLLLVRYRATSWAIAPRSEPHSTALRQKIHLGDPVPRCLFLHVLCAADDDDADVVSVQPEGAKKEHPSTVRGLTVYVCHGQVDPSGPGGRSRRIEQPRPSVSINFHLSSAPPPFFFTNLTAS